MKATSTSKRNKKEIHELIRKNIIALLMNESNFITYKISSFREIKPVYVIEHNKSDIISIFKEENPNIKWSDDNCINCFANYDKIEVPTCKEEILSVYFQYERRAIHYDIFK